MRCTRVLLKIISKFLTFIQSIQIRKCWVHTKWILSAYLEEIAYGALNLKEKTTRIYKSFGRVLNSQLPGVLN